MKRKIVNTGLVNINLRNVPVGLRKELKALAGKRGITLEALCLEGLRNVVGSGNPVRAGGEAVSGGSSIPAMLKAVGAPEAVKQTLVAHCIHSTPVGEICTKCEEHWRLSREYMSEVCAKCQKIRAEHKWLGGEYICGVDENIVFEADARRGDEITIETTRTKDSQAIAVGGRGGFRSGSERNSACGVESSNQDGSERSASKLDGGTVAKADSVYSQGDSDVTQVAFNPYDCPDCCAAIENAYSDATTPGFFYDRCEKHLTTATRIAIYVKTPSGPGAHDDKALAAAMSNVAAHRHVVSKVDPTPRVVDTAAQAPTILQMMRAAAPKGKSAERKK
jgi:hypothetical protein